MKRIPKCCGRPMMAVADQQRKPIWFCPDCHKKIPRKEVVRTD